MLPASRWFRRANAFRIIQVLCPCCVRMLGCSCGGARRSCGRCCLRAASECWGCWVRLSCSAMSKKGVQILDPLFSAFRCCQQVDDLQSRRANAFRIIQVLCPCCVRMLGCSCWGARQSCGRCCLRAASGCCGCWVRLSCSAMSK